MKKICLILIVLTGLSLVGGGNATAGSDDVLDENSRFAVDLVNWIRKDPVGYARDLGVDTQALNQYQPWIAGMVWAGLPVLTFDDNLSQEMKDTDLSKETTDDLMVDQKTVPVCAADFSGVISFLNFMDPKTAIRVVVENQFKQELAGDYPGIRAILNPNLDRVGVVFQVGKKLDNGVAYNAYYITIRLTSVLTKPQAKMLNLINQARKDSVAAGRTWLIGADQLLPGSELPPLFSDSGLQEKANKMVVTADGCDVDELMSDSAVPAYLCQSAVEVFPPADTDADTDAMVGWMFSSLVLAELRGVNIDQVVFNPEIDRAGIGLLFVKGLAYDHVRVNLVAGPVESARITDSGVVSSESDAAWARLCGLVYADTDLNRLYSPGEGRPGREVYIYDKASLVRIASEVTDTAGRYQVVLPKNHDYIIHVPVADDSVVGGVVGGNLLLDKDRFFPVMVSQ